MNICIGPVCLPVWHVLALVAFLFGPVWNFLRGRKIISSVAGAQASLKYAGAAGRELKTKQTEQGQVTPLKHTSSLSGLAAHLTSLQRDCPWLAATEDRLVLIKFTAEWCGPCQRVVPFLDTLRFCYQYAMFEVDMDKSESDLTAGVTGLPTLRLYKWPRGAPCQFSALEKVEEIVGANAAGIENMLAKHCKAF